MKKRYLVLIALPLLITSCNYNENSVYAIKNLDIEENSSSTLIEADAERIMAMYFGMHQFPLYIYKDGCGHCAETTSILNKYAKENQTSIYVLDAESDDFASLKSEISKYFYDGLATPTLYFFKQGNAVSISQDLLNDETRLNRTLSQYLIEYSFSTIYENETMLNSYLNQDEYVVVTLDSKDKSDYLFFEIVASYPAKLSKKNTLILFHDQVGEDINNRLNTLFEGVLEHRAIIKKDNVTNYYDLSETSSSFLIDLNNFYIKN